MHEGFNIFEGPDAEESSGAARSASEDGVKSEDREPDRGAANGTEQATAVDHGASSDEGDVFESDFAPDLEDSESAVVVGGRARRHLRGLVLGALAIFVLALAGTLFGSSTRRPATEPTPPGDPAGLEQAGPRAPRLSPPRDLSPERRRQRPRARAAPHPRPSKPEDKRPPMTAAAEPIAVEEPPDVVAPDPDPQGAAVSAASREFDFER